MSDIEDDFSEYFSDETSLPACPFCMRIETHDYEQSYIGVVVRFEPLNPVVPGHMLFVPSWHVEHPSGEGVRAAMGYAESYGGRKRQAFNLITSSGTAATQTILHIHVHYVPRREGDGLLLPWSPTPSSPESASPGPEAIAHPGPSRDVDGFGPGCVPNVP